MNYDELSEYCLSKKGATEGEPFGPGALVFKAGPKMFATLAYQENDLRITLKCLPELAEELRKGYDAIIPGYYMNKKHWNTIIIDGSVADDFLKSLIDDSYELVFQGLQRSEKEEISSR